MIRRRHGRRAAAALLSLTIAGAPAAVAQQAVDVPGEEIVVTGRAEPRALPHAVEYFDRHCVRASRLERAARLPDGDPDWHLLSHDDAAAFGVTDPAVDAYGLRDDVRGHTLLMKTERVARPDGLTEDHCTLVVVGGAEHALLVGRINSVMGGPGTDRHVNHAAGTPALPDWDQRVWSAMPSRRSKAWRVVQADGAARAAGTWLTVLDPSFYDDHDYVLVDLKTRRTGQPVSVLTLAWTRRGDGTRAR